MLLAIEIRNFAIISSLSLDLSSGMTVVTGETGAGKSILVDALGLTLGERADQSVISHGAKQAEISAIFELEPESPPHSWLEENDLSDDDSIKHEAQKRSECILRRVIVKEGRSKCYINGRSVTQSQLKSLGCLLIDIHGQHGHQSLLKSKEQLNLLDRYANHADLVDNVRLAHKQLKKIEKRKLQLEEEKLARDAKRELLTYQVEELVIANPDDTELANLENKHNQAATSQERFNLVSETLTGLSEEETSSCLSKLRGSMSQFSKVVEMDPSLASLLETLKDTESVLQDISMDLVHYKDELDINPEEYERLDNRLSQFHDLARKHQVSLADLPLHFAKLNAEMDTLQADDLELNNISSEYEKSIRLYYQQANLLTQSRKKIAIKLEKLITGKLQLLAMEGGNFAIRLNEKKSTYNADGTEDVEFLVSANPGQPLQSLIKVASGGELSRISLAVSVITSEQQLVPTVIFDEVDVGIGGATAETVGSLLNQLAGQKQVICVTHQPQVASFGNHHLIACKSKHERTTTTEVIELNQTQRIEEIARMLGGKIISEKTILHATEMLASN